jgi:hypothetical protein
MGRVRSLSENAMLRVSLSMVVASVGVILPTVQPGLAGMIVEPLGTTRLSRHLGIRPGWRAHAL